MEFPHMDDTSYPNLDNVDVYAYRNEFDYTRWEPNTKLCLTNVLWNGDFEDCVKFESDIERDRWFDEHVAETVANDPASSVVLKTNVTIVNGTVKVPLPFDRAAQYNYLVVDVPIITSAGQPLNYETEDGYRRWHFFINDLAYSAPSTTVLTLALDVWTQFINTVGFNYFLLERGHAPVHESDTDSYLANPIDNCEYLLAPDVDFGGDTVSRGGEFIPFGNGEKYICFASTCEPSQFASIGNVMRGAQYAFSDPTFFDSTANPDSTNRWGRQFEVSGYGFGTGKSYANVSTPVGNGISSNGRIPTATTVYAIAATEADEFVNDVLANSPSFLNTVQACFMVAKELITLGNSHTLAGHAVYECQGSDSELGSVTLTKEMFGIPERYQRFAKLYTFPYSELEITDNNGKTATVRVESTGSIKAHGIVSLAYPYLNMRMFLTGIGGSGSHSYQWQDMRGSHDMEMVNGDWYRFCYDMDIPMYALYMDGQTSWELGNYNRQYANARNSAIVNYHNSVREANNAMHNAQDTAQTNRNNSVSSANTELSNNTNSANTMQTNANNDANTMNSNHANSRACATDITATNNSAANANTSSHNSQIWATNTHNNDMSYSQMLAGNSFTLNTSKEENQTSVAVAGNNSIAQTASAAGDIAAAAITGAAVAGPAGALAGAAMGALQSAGTLVGASTTLSNASMTAQCNSAVASLQVNYNDTVYRSTNVCNTQNATTSSKENTEVNQHNVNAAASNTARSNSCDAANTANSVSNIKTNAANTRNTAVTNATNSRDTSVANAERLKSNTDSVSDWSDRTAIANAQDVLRNTQNQFKAVSNDAKNMYPVRLCQDGGDSAPDYMRTRGVQVKVRTQSKGSIRAAGDEFVRHGYNLNQIWDVDELCLMKHFTYWKASDLWVYDKGESSDFAQQSIGNIFRNGVTVWSNPNEIGKVNPYDN